VVGPKTDRCWTIAYAPKDDPEIEAIIDKILAHNNPPIPRSSVIGFASIIFIGLLLNLRSIFRSGRD
jgi:hypothetical protein